MEKETEGILLKTRSSRACMAEGFRLYLGQFKRIFRYTWLVAIFFAVVNGLFGTYYVMEYPRLMVAVQMGSAGIRQMAGMFAVMVAGSLLLMIAYVLLWSYLFSMLNVHKATGEMPWAPKLLHFDRTMAWRMLKAMLWALLFTIIIGGVMAAVGVIGGKVLSPMTTVGLLIFVMIIIGVLLVPLYYVFYKYLLTPGLKFTSILSVGYTIGMHHLGSLLSVLFVTSIVVAMAALLTSLPMMVLFLANIQAQTGLLMGDPLGMPSYMTTLTAVVFVLASFLQAYVLMAEAFPLYYAYGSIEVSEDERNKTLSKYGKK